MLDGILLLALNELFALPRRSNAGADSDTGSSPCPRMNILLPFALVRGKEKKTDKDVV